jgi:hypothetical protein
MTTPYMTEVSAADRSRELRRQACTARLVALARCCRPSAWGRAARRAGEAVTRLRAAVRCDRSAAASCCA